MKSWKRTTLHIAPVTSQDISRKLRLEGRISESEPDSNSQTPLNSKDRESLRMGKFNQRELFFKFYNQLFKRAAVHKVGSGSS